MRRSTVSPPLQFPAGQNAQSLGLTDKETLAIVGLDGLDVALATVQMKVIDPQGQTRACRYAAAHVNAI